VEQFYALEKPVTLTGRGTFAGADGNGAIWAETLRASDPSTTTDLLYGAGNGWLAGHPAMVTRAVGKGSIGLLGDATHSVLIVINHNTTPQDVTLNGRYKSLLAGTFLRVAGVDGQRSTVFALPGQGVAVLTLERVP
jgi:hypothetical protein